ncbi:MAG: glycosyltransferase family 4 protein [Acutalibacteraceae bacterium]|jgi:1,2-diacylglycerol-3-alpha-glucose alpha-1,2-galactosyltransferase
MNTISMMSKADMTKGHGVLSVYEELMTLLQTYYPDKYRLQKNTVKQADIYHYHTINPGFFLTLPIARHRGTTVGFVHFVPKTLEESVHLWKIARAPFYWYVMRFYHAMDDLVTVNPHFVEDLVEAGIERDKITYIPNCVSTDAFYPLSAEEKAALRDRLGLPRDKRIVIGAGQLQIRKGVLDFVEVAKAHPDKLFLWLGGFSFGKISDGYEQIKAVMAAPPDNLRFVGMVDRGEMNDWYNAADLLLLPSFAELFPMTILEALNCHMPIVVRDLPEYHGVVSDYVRMCPDTDGFVSAIDRLCTDGEAFRQASERSAAGSAYYSTENVAKMWDAFYTARIAHPRRQKTKKAV